MLTRDLFAVANLLVNTLAAKSRMAEQTTMQLFEFYSACTSIRIMLSGFS